MSKIAVATQRFSGFMKRNAMYLLILLCIASVATVIALAVTGNFGEQSTPLTPDDSINTPVDNKPNDTPTDNKPQTNKPSNDGDAPIINNPVIEAMIFGAPCQGTVVTEHSDSVLVWNSTLSQYSTHTGVDFVADNDQVLAVANGVVNSVGYDPLNGHYIVIDHREGYQSRYYSLDEGITLKEGDTVTKGQVIATISDTMATEAHTGKHLHLEMSKDGEEINPLSVIILTDK